MANLFTDIAQSYWDFYKNTYNKSRLITFEKQNNNISQISDLVQMSQYDSMNKNHVNEEKTSVVKNTTHSSFNFFKEDTGAIDVEKIKAKFEQFQNTGKNKNAKVNKKTGSPVVTIIFLFIIFGNIIPEIFS